MHAAGNSNRKTAQHAHMHKEKRHTSRQGSTHQVMPLFVWIGICSNHEAHCLIEHVYLMSLQILYGQRQVIQELRDEGLLLTNLQATQVEAWRRRCLSNPLKVGLVRHNRRELCKQRMPRHGRSSTQAMCIVNAYLLVCASFQVSRTKAELQAYAG